MHWVAYKKGDTDIPEGVQLLVQRRLTLFNTVPGYQVARFSKDLFKVDDVDFFDYKGVSGFYEYDSEWGYLPVNYIVAYAVIDEYKPVSEEDEEKICKWCIANCFPGPLCPDTYCIEAREGAL